jgi:hypothetical protein
MGLAHLGEVTLPSIASGRPSVTVVQEPGLVEEVLRTHVDESNVENYFVEPETHAAKEAILQWASANRPTKSTEKAKTRTSDRAKKEHRIRVRMCSKSHLLTRRSSASQAARPSQHQRGGVIPSVLPAPR